MRPPLIKTYPYDYPPLGLQEHPAASHRLPSRAPYDYPPLGLQEHPTASPRLTFKKRAAYSFFSSATNASPTL